MTLVHPLLDQLGSAIHSLNNPSQYLGGEYGISTKPASYRVGVIFPDVYAIGMSNHSIKVLYDVINRLDDVRAERSFAPETDLEVLLKARGLGLGTLETGTLLKDLDLLGVSVGFELSATNILTILDLGGLSLRAVDRSEDSPLVIAGGPALSNPLPFGAFFDGIVIGEAEAMLPGLIEELKVLKQQGATRAQQLEVLRRLPSVWYPGKSGRTTRAVWHGFAKQPAGLNFPVPSIKVAQDHGVVEIMRGCPQGCRFCHAGMFYRPFRQKPPQGLAADVRAVLKQQGYRSITLSSLSSGDYPGIKDVFRQLNKQFGQAAVSFSLPSLKVNSFNLDLVEELASGKKSGLTFAVESPALIAQQGINKLVALEDTIKIIKEAKSQGWKSVKLYFMIGLPTAGYDDPQAEMAAIREYILAVRHQAGVSVNVTVGTFVPKPHTPFQWAGQIPYEEAHQRLGRLKNSIKDGAIKISYQNAFHSFLEGVLARGDERVADLIEDAWKHGARFDAWDEKLDRNLWLEVFARAGWDVESSVTGGFEEDKALPWASINIGVASAYLLAEARKARQGQLTPHCIDPCDHHCGSCGSAGAIDKAIGPEESVDIGLAPEDTSTLPMRLGEVPKDTPAIIFSFSKDRGASFIPHLGIVNTFERAFMRAEVPFGLTNGFSPTVILELAQALSVGISSDEEMAIVYLHQKYSAQDFVERMNQVLPQGVRIRQALEVYGIRHGKKAPSLSSLAESATYLLDCPEVPTENSAADPSHGASTGLSSGEHTFPLSGPLSLRHRAEATWGADYQAQGLKAHRRYLSTSKGRGFEGFTSFYEVDS